MKFPSLADITSRFKAPARTAKPINTVREPGAAYDATETKARRKQASGLLVTEDNELTRKKRRQLISGNRDLARNYAAAAWAIRKHLDYVATFTFQARTSDEGLNQDLEDYLATYNNRENCDIGARHPLDRMVRIAEARRIIDGDCFILKLRDGRLQPIESERIDTPSDAGNADEWTHGIKTAPGGAAISYALCSRTQYGRSAGPLEREIPAAYVIHHAQFDRFEQVRGISPLAAAYNTLRDTYEAFDYALAKLKVSQLFTMAFYRDAVDPVGSITPQPTDGDTTTADKYDVDFGRGPVKLELDPGDRAEFLEAKTPSAEFQNYTQAMIGLALKALDIPFSFYDEAYSNYSGSRQALLMYEQSAQAKRNDVRIILNHITQWRLALAVAAGDILIPRNVSITARNWEWVAAGIPWIDPLKEINADIAAIGAGLDSTPAVCKRSGTDAYDLARQESAYQTYRASLGLAPAGGPAAITLQDAPTQ